MTAVPACTIALGADYQGRILAAFRRFDDDNMSDLHDIGDLEIPLSSPANTPAKPELISFRIDRAAACRGTRMLSIMLASEW